MTVSFFLGALADSNREGYTKDNIEFLSGDLLKRALPGNSSKVDEVNERSNVNKTNGTGSIQKVTVTIRFLFVIVFFPWVQLN